MHNNRMSRLAEPQRQAVDIRSRDVCCPSFRTTDVRSRNVNQYWFSWTEKVEVEVKSICLLLTTLAGWWSWSSSTC